MERSAQPIDDYPTALKEEYYKLPPTRKFLSTFEGLTYDIATDKDHAFGDHVPQAFWDYLFKGIPPGNFFEGILSNNLWRACGSADNWNRKVIYWIVQWVMINCPHEAIGSEEKIKAWCALPMKERHRLMHRHRLIPDLFDVILTGQPMDVVT